MKTQSRNCRFSIVEIRKSKPEIRSEKTAMTHSIFEFRFSSFDLRLQPSTISNEESSMRCQPPAPIRAEFRFSIFDFRFSTFDFLLQQSTIGNRQCIARRHRPLEPSFEFRISIFAFRFSIFGFRISAPAIVNPLPHPSRQQSHPRQRPDQARR